MKKLPTIITVLLILVIVVILYISYLVNTNNNYLSDITKKIQDNYKITEKITYTNQYGNYYIIKTTSNVIVLNKEYKEILKENISKIEEQKDNMELIYKTNTLMYEEKILKKNTLTYKYYDAKTGKFLKETIMEQK